MPTTSPPRPRDAAPAPAGVLSAAAAAARIVPLPDDTGLGLLHFGVLPAVPVTGASQVTTLPGTGVALGTLTELLGIELTAAWQALFPPRGYPAGGAGGGEPDPARGVPGTLLPVSTDGPSATGGPGDPLDGLAQRFLALPPLSSTPGTWEAQLEVTVSARAQPPALPTPVDQAGALELSLDATLGGGPLSGTLKGPVRAAVTAAGDEATVGPLRIPLLLPTLPVPPLLLLFRGVNFQPPGLVVCPVPALGGSLNGLVQVLGDAMLRVDLVRRMLERASLPLPASYAGLGSALQLLFRLLGSPAMRVLTTRGEPNLNLHDLMLGVVNDIEAEDELRSLVYVGLPGPNVDLYPHRDFRAGGGDRFLRIGVTREMAAQGRLVVQLSDLDERTVPGVLHAADMQHTLLFTKDASSFRFSGI